jgi:hypothetical protein
LAESASATSNLLAGFLGSTNEAGTASESSRETLANSSDCENSRTSAKSEQTRRDRWRCQLLHSVMVFSARIRATIEMRIVADANDQRMRSQMESVSRPACDRSRLCPSSPPLPLIPTIRQLQAGHKRKLPGQIARSVLASKMEARFMLMSIGSLSPGRLTSCACSSAITGAPARRKVA